MKEYLTREEMISVIERKGSAKYVPSFLLNWWGTGTEEKYGEELKKLEREYPADVYCGELLQPGNAEAPAACKNPGYRWGYKDYTNAETHSIARTPVLMEDWEELDRLFADFPDPDEPGILDGAVKGLEKAGGRYRLGLFWQVFHEFFWQIRGMENVMGDYVEDIDNLKILGQRVLQFHKRIVDRFAEAGFDGIMTSDDLGFQTGPMMQPSVFKEVHLPLYKEFVEHVHKKGMHVWLHSCGDNTLLMDSLVESGIDVLHPIQKGCMDEKAVAEKYGGKITFLYGIDVQHLVPMGTPEEIREEVRAARKLFGREDGGLIIAAANGIMPDAPMENIKALYEEVYQGRKDVEQEDLIPFGMTGTVE